MEFLPNYAKKLLRTATLTHAHIRCASAMMARCHKARTCIYTRAVNRLKYLIRINRTLFICSKCTFKCMYIFIIGNQLKTQNNYKYYPETLTGTTLSIKNYAQIITWQTQAQQATTAVSVSVC